MPPPPVLARALAAALAAAASASAITINAYMSATCSGTSVGSLKAYTDVCAPQLGAAFAGGLSPVASLSAASVVGGGVAPITSVQLSGYANNNCGGAAVISATVTTTCGALTGYPGVYAVIVASDTIPTAAALGGAFYVGGCSSPRLATPLRARSLTHQP